MDITKNKVHSVLQGTFKGDRSSISDEEICAFYLVAINSGLQMLVLEALNKGFTPKTPSIEWESVCLAWLRKAEDFKDIVLRAEVWAKMTQGVEINDIFILKIIDSLPKEKIQHSQYAGAACFLGIPEMNAVLPRLQAKALLPQQIVEMIQTSAQKNKVILERFIEYCFTYNRIDYLWWILHGSSKKDVLSIVKKKYPSQALVDWTVDFVKSDLFFQNYGFLFVLFDVLYALSGLVNKKDVSSFSNIWVQNLVESSVRVIDFVHHENKTPDVEIKNKATNLAMLLKEKTLVTVWLDAMKNNFPTSTGSMFLSLDSFFVGMAIREELSPQQKEALVGWICFSGPGKVEDASLKNIVQHASIEDKEKIYEMFVKEGFNVFYPWTSLYLIESLNKYLTDFDETKEIYLALKSPAYIKDFPTYAARKVAQIKCSTETTILNNLTHFIKDKVKKERL